MTGESDVQDVHNARNKEEDMQRTDVTTSTIASTGDEPTDPSSHDKEVRAVNPEVTSIIIADGVRRDLPSTTTSVESGAPEITSTEPNSQAMDLDLPTVSSQPNEHATVPETSKLEATSSDDVGRNEQVLQSEMAPTTSPACDVPSKSNPPTQQTPARSDTVPALISKSASIESASSVVADDYIRSPEIQNAIVERSPGGRYVRFMEKLGSGASKDVYRAYDTQEGIEVAWNVVSLSGVPKSERNRIVNEVRLLERLHHHNIISFHGSWVNRERQEVNFVTEILSSGTLKSFINKVQVIRWKIAKRWAVQILNGLDYLHSQDPPVIHRDLKCENIFINGTSGDLRIGDLGLSTVHRNNGRVLSVLGTPEFMAPDMYEETSYDEKVDVYAFGMCMLEIFTKEIPYSECKNPAQIYKKVSSGEPPDVLARLQSKHARDFVVLCLGYKNGEGRFVRPSVSELLQHPFLMKRSNDDDEVIVDPPLRERSISEASESAAISTARVSRHEQLKNSNENLSGPKNDNMMRRRPSLANSIDDTEGDTFQDMQESEIKMRKVKVLMGRGQELEEEDDPKELHQNAFTSQHSETTSLEAVNSYSSVYRQPEPQQARANASAFQQPNGSVLQEQPLQSSTPPNVHRHQFEQQQHMASGTAFQQQVQSNGSNTQDQSQQPNIRHSLQLHQQPQTNAAPFHLQAQGNGSMVQDRPQQGQVHHQLLENQQAQSNLPPFHQQIPSNGSMIQEPQQSNIHLMQQSQSNSLMMQQHGQSQIMPPIQMQHHQLPSNEMLGGAMQQQPTQHLLHREMAPIPSQPSLGSNYLVAAAVIEFENPNVRPYADDILKLVVTLPVDGQTQNVQFDFHLVEDDPVQVAKEMVQELGIPMGAVLEISETISGLARSARMKQDRHAIRLQQSAHGQMHTQFAQVVGHQNQHGLSQVNVVGSSTADYIPHHQHGGPATLHQGQQQIQQQGLSLSTGSPDLMSFQQQQGQHIQAHHTVASQEQYMQNNIKQQGAHLGEHHVVASNSGLQDYTMYTKESSAVAHYVNQSLRSNSGVVQDQFQYQATMTQSLQQQKGMVPNGNSQDQYGQQGMHQITQQGSIPLQKLDPPQYRRAPQDHAHFQHRIRPQASLPGQHVPSNTTGNKKFSGGPSQDQYQFQQPASGGLILRSTLVDDFNTSNNAVSNAFEQPDQAQNKPVALDPVYGPSSYTVTTHGETAAPKPAGQEHKYPQSHTLSYGQTNPASEFSLSNVPVQSQAPFQDNVYSQPQVDVYGQSGVTNDAPVPQTPLQVSATIPPQHLYVVQPSQAGSLGISNYTESTASVSLSYSSQNQGPSPLLSATTVSIVQSSGHSSNPNQALQTNSPSNVPSTATSHSVSQAHVSNAAVVHHVLADQPIPQTPVVPDSGDAAIGHTSHDSMVSLDAASIPSASTSATGNSPITSQKQFSNESLLVGSGEYDSEEDDDLSEEMRKLDEEFQRNLLRAKKVFVNRMDNLQRSQVEREAQHQKTLERHEKERADYERRLAQEEEQQSRRIEQLQKEWDKKRESVAQSKRKNQSSSTRNGVNHYGHEIGQCSDPLMDPSTADKLGGSVS